METPTPKPLIRIQRFFESGAYKPWFAGAVVFLLFLGAWQRFSLPLEPITTKDTGNYISPALAMLVDGSYEPTKRDFPYAGFIWLLLKTTGTFASITVAQHLCGLAGGFLFWLTWLRLQLFLPRDWRITALHAVLGFVLAWGLLLSRQPIFFEQMMRPEGVYPFFISLHLFGAVCFLERSLIRRSLPPAIWWGAFMTAVSLGLYVLKPIWGLAIVCGGLPFLIVFACARGKWRAVPLAAGALGAAAGVALFFLPNARLSSIRAQPVASSNMALFFVHADLVGRELQRDLAGPGETPFPREIILATADEFQTAFKGKGRKPYRTLGFNPDDLIYGTASDRVRDFFIYQPGAANRFYRHYYLQAWRRQPLQMLGKIFRELSVFYRCDSKITSNAAVLTIGSAYEASAALCAQPEYLKRYRDWGPFKDYMEAVRRGTSSDEHFKPDFLRTVLSFVNSTYVVVLAIFLIAGLLWGSKRDRKNGGVPLFWLGFWLYSYNFGITLTVAIVHSMSVQRYTDTEFCLTLFSFCSGLLLLVSILLSRFSSLACSQLTSGGICPLVDRE